MIFMLAPLLFHFVGTERDGLGFSSNAGRNVVLAAQVRLDPQATARAIVATAEEEEAAQAQQEGTASDTSVDGKHDLSDCGSDGSQLVVYVGK